MLVGVSVTVGVGVGDTRNPAESKLNSKSSSGTMYSLLNIKELIP